MTKRQQSHASNEDGIVVAAVAGGLVLVLIFVMVAAAVASSSQHRSQRAKEVTRAQAAADAGLNTALFRLNQVQPENGYCAVKPANSTTIVAKETSTTWCPMQQETLEGGAGFRYSVESHATTQAGGCGDAASRRIVSVGYDARGVTRTVTQTVSLAGGVGLFAKCGVLADEEIRLSGHARVLADAGSDGDINVTSSGPPSSQICGSAWIAQTGQINTEQPDQICSTANTNAPLLNLESYVFPENNPSYRDDTLSPSDDGQVGPGRSRRLRNCTGQTAGNYGWNAANRELTLKGPAGGCPAVLELRGDNYRFCKIQLEGSAKLVIPTRSPDAPPLKIWMLDPDSPACAGVTNSSIPFRVDANATIINDNSDPTTFMLLGEPLSKTNQRKAIEFNSAVTSSQAPIPMVVWAPEWTVNLRGDSAILGGIAGNEVVLDTWSKAIWGEAVAYLGRDLLRLGSAYTRDSESWNQCGPVTDWTDPDDRC